MTESCQRIESVYLPGGSGSNGNTSAAVQALNAENKSTVDSKDKSTESVSSPPVSTGGYAATQTSMNSRTQKLAKQLREALAWSSCRDQTSSTTNVAVITTDSAATATTTTTVETLYGTGTKYSSADNALTSFILINRPNDMIFQELETIKTRLDQLFYHISSTNYDFKDTKIDLAGISGTSLLGNLIHSTTRNSKSNEIELVMGMPVLNTLTQQLKLQKCYVQSKLNVFNDILRIDKGKEIDCLTLDL